MPEGAPNCDAVGGISYSSFVIGSKSNICRRNLFASLPSYSIISLVCPPFFCQWKSTKILSNYQGFSFQFTTVQLSPVTERERYLINSAKTLSCSSPSQLTCVVWSTSDCRRVKAPPDTVFLPQCSCAPYRPNGKPLWILLLTDMSEWCDWDFQRNFNEISPDDVHMVTVIIESLVPRTFKIMNRDTFLAPLIVLSFWSKRPVIV